MKIYRKVKIDIDTLEVTEEDSFEYNGELAECKGGSSVDYQTSPEQRAIYKELLPLVKDFRKVRSGGTLWDVPEGPTAPQAPDALLPGAGWYENIDSSLKAAAWEPWNEGARQMLGVMNRRGQVGTPSAGYTPAGGAALGEYYQNATPQVAAQTWNMLSPYRQFEMNRVGADYSMAIDEWAQGIQSRSFPYTAMPGMLGGTYGDAVVKPGEPNRGAMMLGGATTGAAAGASLGASYGSAGGPWGAAIGGVLGALGGLMY